MNKPKLQISFSGGETSAYMANRLIKEYGDSHEIIVLFANTGQEADETLEFVDKCDHKFGLNLIWLEAVVNPQKGKGSQAKVVSFQSASRNGEPFEAVISKYGIPSPINLACTRELKIVPMQNYLRSIGWNKNTYKTAIGIRVDELDRIREDAESNNIIYPLIQWNIDKPAINRFWRDMPFRLNLKSWEGNCKTCWKKSDRKLFAIAKDHPEWFDFFALMEKKYSNDVNRCFFRGYRTVADIFEQSKSTHFSAPKDDRELVISLDQLTMFSDLDFSDGCTGSCEAY